MLAAFSAPAVLLGCRMIVAVTARAADLERLCTRLGVRRLALFESAAAAIDDAVCGDLDFVVEFQPAALDNYANAYFGLLEALEKTFEMPVDLVVRSAIQNPYFLESVGQTRAVLYEA